MAMPTQPPPRQPPGDTPQGIPAGAVIPEAPATPFTQPQPLPAGPEQELWAGRTQWRHYSGRVVLWFLLNAIVIVGGAYITSQSTRLTWSTAAWIIVVVVLLISVFVLGGPAKTIWGRRYRLTSQRLFIERGIFSKTIDQMESTRVEDLQIEKAFLDRLFGLGTVALLTTDVSDRKVLVEGVHEPDKVAEIIRARMRSLRGRSVFVENLTP